MAENSNQNGQNQKPGLSWSQPTQSSQNTGGQNNRPTTPPNMKPASPNDSNSTAWWITAGVIVVLGLIIWAVVASRHNNNDTSTTGMGMATTTVTSGNTATSTMVGTSTMMMASSSNKAMPSGTVPVSMSTDTSQLTVPTPQSAGTSVTVSNIIVTNPTWVVVYEDNNGKPGNALGAAFFISGRTNGVVDLLRNTIAGQTYLVTEAQDNGSRVFSLADAPVLDQSGNQVWVQFQAN
jgi:hypothetical protein